MKKELIEKIFKIMYPDITINSIELLPRNEYIDNEWKPTSPSIFVGIKYNSEGEINDISNILTNLTNYEFNVFLV
jgi:hypothetical protein